jgi:hypothetical protein
VTAPVPVVIDLEDDVDVILLPAELAAKARACAPGFGEARLLGTIALLIARLGAETALPAIAACLEDDPGVLIDFPERLRSALADGTLW